MTLNSSCRLHEAARLKKPLTSNGLVFYTHTLCPYAQRVWLTLLHKVNGIWRRARHLQAVQCQLLIHNMSALCGVNGLVSQPAI
jgi:hypothetical protein